MENTTETYTLNPEQQIQWLAGCETILADLAPEWDNTCLDLLATTLCAHLPESPADYWSFVHSAADTYIRTAGGLAASDPELLSQTIGLALVLELAGREPDLVDQYFVDLIFAADSERDTDPFFPAPGEILTGPATLQ